MNRFLVADIEEILWLFWPERTDRWHRGNGAKQHKEGSLLNLRYTWTLSWYIPNKLKVRKKKEKLQRFSNITINAECQLIRFCETNQNIFRIFSLTLLTVCELS